MDSDVVGTVMYVESNDDLRGSIQTLLVKAGIVPETYATTDEARERLNRGNGISLMVIDTQFPKGMQGDAFAMEVRRKFPKLQVIFLTHDGESDGLPDCPVLYKCDVEKDPQYLIQLVWARLKFIRTDRQLVEIKGTGDETLGLVKQMIGKLDATTLMAALLQEAETACRTETHARLTTLEASERELCGTVSQTRCQISKEVTDKINDIDLPTLAKNWAAKPDWLTRGVIGVLVAIILGGAAYVKHELMQKIEEVPHLDNRLSKVEASLGEQKSQLDRVNDVTTRTLESVMALRGYVGRVDPSLNNLRSPHPSPAPSSMTSSYSTTKTP
jgi:CheY-like chemotaxis protein